MKTPIQKSPVPDGFTDEICQTFEEFSIKSSQTFPKKLREHSQILYEASLTLIQRQIRILLEKKAEANYS